MKLKTLILAASMALFLQNCVTSAPFAGFIDTSQFISNRGGNVGIASAKIVKKGESCREFYSYFSLDYFWMYSGKAPSIEEARENGGINKIALVETVTNQRIFGSKNCVVVWGE